MDVRELLSAVLKILEVVLVEVGLNVVVVPELVQIRRAPKYHLSIKMPLKTLRQ